MAIEEHSHHYVTQVAWDGSTKVGYDAYDRTHRASTVPATVDLELASDPAFNGDPAKLNPEQLLVLAASSCQLLSFLAVAARARVDVVSYRDEAEGEMRENDRPMRLTRITLRPHITVALAASVEVRDAVDRTERYGIETQRLERLCAIAHDECFIANSLRSDIVVEPTITFIDASIVLP